MKKSLRQSLRVDPDVLDQQTSEVNAKLEKNADKMSAIAAYLQSRKKQNGFGADFEFTLRARKTT